MNWLILKLIIVLLEGKRDSDGDISDAMAMPRRPHFESGALIREGDSEKWINFDYAEIVNFISESGKKSMSIAVIAESEAFLELEECLMKYKALVAE